MELFGLICQYFRFCVSELIADEFVFQYDTVWVTQKGMAAVFDSSKQNISYHLSNIFNEELNESSVVKEILTTAADGR